MAASTPDPVPQRAIPDAPVVDLVIGGESRRFDLDDPALPKWIKKGSFGSGGYPYKEKLDGETYQTELAALQAELVKVQFHLKTSGERLMILFEGRDAAGKGGTINAVRENLNPRALRTVALPKPSDVERGQWYYQRYVAQFPTDGEIVLFDRSWYNRAGVEPVMGFCTPEEHEAFLTQTPRLEQMLVEDGIRLFKIWLNIGQEMQLKRFHDRRHDPLKVWKLSPIDVRALEAWDAYTQARDTMFRRTHTHFAPWTVVRSNDKRRARLNTIRLILDALDYEGKDRAAVGTLDPQIVMPADTFLASLEPAQENRVMPGEAA